MQPMSRDVETIFNALPAELRHRLVEIRSMIFDVAAADPRIGMIAETLKWGEPAYLTEASGSGSTIRLGISRQAPDRAAIFFICRTTLVEEFRARFGAGFDYEGSRAVLLPKGVEVARPEVEFMLARALTYHLRPRDAIR